MSDKYAVVPFQLVHLDFLHDSQEHFSATADIAAFLQRGYSRSLAWTGLIDGVPLAAVGIYVDRGIGYGWALVRPLAKTYAVFVHRTVKRYLQDLFPLLPIRRLQALVLRPDEIGAEAWLVRLGFEWEGVLRRIGPRGEDFSVYAMVK